MLQLFDTWSQIIRKKKLNNIFNGLIIINSFFHYLKWTETNISYNLEMHQSELPKLKDFLDDEKLIIMMKSIYDIHFDHFNIKYWC